MAAGEANDNDAMATLDFDEFVECLARCARDKYGEIKLMTLAQGVRGVIQNILGEKSDEAVIRDATYIHADRYNWKLSKPLAGQSLTAHRKWLDCWQNIEIADLHHFPLWERDVHDLLQKHFGQLCLIFLAYCRSVLGSDTAEDAMEMEMAEFKDFVDECRLETKSIGFDQMTNQFIKANATNSAAVRDAKAESRRSAGTKQDHQQVGGGKGVARDADGRTTCT